MIQSLKPGQDVRCTIKSLPRTPDDISTIERLMRNDPNFKRGLTRSQRLRRQNMVTYNRGNRDWVKRERVGKIVRAVLGATWTMPYTPLLANDMKVVSDLIDVKAA